MKSSSIERLCLTSSQSGLNTFTSFHAPSRDICGWSLHTVGSKGNSACNSGNIRESVDSLCRDGADAQYMQYLSKSRITSPQTR